MRYKVILQEPYIALVLYCEEKNKTLFKTAQLQRAQIHGKNIFQSRD